MSTPAWVNGNSFANSVTTSLAVKNTSSTVSAGNIIVMVVGSFWDGGTPGRPSITDNQGNTFVWQIGGANSSLDGCRIDLFTSPPLASGAAINGYIATIKAAQTSGFNEIGSSIHQWSGFGTIGAGLDIGATALLNAGDSSGTVTLLAGTAQQAVEALICAIHFNDDTNPDGIGTPTGTGTWVLDVANTNASIGLAVGYAHQVTSATGTAYSAIWSGLDITTNNGGSMLIAALFPIPLPTALATGLPQHAGPGNTPFKQYQFATRPLWNLPSQSPFTLTGQLIAATAGTATAAQTLSVAGSGAASAIGSVALTLGPPLAGQVVAATTGAIAASSTYVLSGASATFSTGTISSSAFVDVTLSLNGQLASFNSGLIAANGDLIRGLSGLAITSGIGSLSVGVAFDQAGQVLGAAAGIAGLSFTAALAGQSSVSAIGSLSWTPFFAPLGQILAGTAGTVGGGLTSPLTGVAAQFQAGSITPPGVNAGTTWDSGIITWDSGIQTWDGGSTLLAATLTGQIPSSGPGISPDYNRLFQPMRGATSAVATTATATLTGAQIASAAGSVFAQINTTLTLGLVGTVLAGRTGAIAVSSNVTVGLIGQQMAAGPGAILYAPIYPTDGEYEVSIDQRAFSAAHDSIQGFTVVIAPRSFTVAGG